MKAVTLFAFILLAGQVSTAYAQRSYTKDGTVHFVSDTPMEKIEATNHKATCVLDESTGQIQIAILIKSFHFDRALMEEHFNENYMESSKYPKATFKGRVQNFENLDFSEDTENKVTIQGTMTIHGVTKEISSEGTLSKAGGFIKATAFFEIDAEDYDVKIPGLVRENIAETIEIDVDLSLQPLVQ